MKHVSQPSRTSCGPACAAILAGVQPHVMVDRLPEVRVTLCRKRLKTHRTNIGEMRRLLVGYGLGFARRRRGIPTSGDALLRIQHERGRNWHFAVFHGGVVFDPGLPTKLSAVEYLSDIDVTLVSFYQVQGGARG